MINKQAQQQNNFKVLSQINNYGCMAINRLTNQVLLIKLRWTRSGAKSLFHILNGLDNTKKDFQNISQILQNCTDDELKVFQRELNQLLHESQIPLSWQSRDGQNLENNIKKNYDFVKQICQKELNSRQQDKSYKPQPDQLSRHMWMIPKGKAEKCHTNSKQQKKNEEADCQSTNSNKMDIKIQDDKEYETNNAKREFSEETDVPEQDVYFVKNQNNEYIHYQASNGLKCFIVYLDRKWEIKNKWNTENNETYQSRWFTLSDALDNGYTKGMIDILKKLKRNFDEITYCVSQYRQEEDIKLIEQLKNEQTEQKNKITKKIKKSKKHKKHKKHKSEDKSPQIQSYEVRQDSQETI